jgi:hypothetical protein
MTWRFAHEVTTDSLELRLLADDKRLAVDRWALDAPAAMLQGVDVAQRLIAAGSAIYDDDVLLVEHAAVAGLSAREASSLDLPAATELRAVVQGTGNITQPGFRVTLSWQRPTGQPVIGAERIGAFIRFGTQRQRLPSTLFEVAVAVDRLAAVANDDLPGRLESIAALREALPPAEASGEAEPRGLVGRITIAQADAFSLDMQGEGEAARLVPILHRSGAAADLPLLPPERQRAFGEDQFHLFGTARAVYTLGDGFFVVLDPPLRRALSEVRRIASSSAATRRAFFAAPRAFLREALGDDTDPTVVERVFQETESWSSRVVGLGLWEKRVVPWVKLPGTDWFGPEVGAPGAPSSKSAPAVGILVDDKHIPLELEQIVALQARVEEAIASGRPCVDLVVDGERIEIPARHETLSALQQAEAAASRPPSKPATNESSTAEVVIIKPNEAELELEEDVALRPSPPLRLPSTLATTPKPHQAEGLEWLQRAWKGGLPGVLLADDMGLGKTLQGLAFLAWLREGMLAGTIERAPILIVAPTGLLENWRAEHDRHLSAPGLGVCLPAYAKGLAALRVPGLDARPSLDLAQIRRADWVLTTYETLRDYDRDFGRVRFAALLFDEAQKIKTPGVRLTDAAKAMNADLRVALTGTPVENRLADLWCIVDAVHPGCLDDLKTFSARYEKSPDAENLRRLRRSLVHEIGGRPKLMLRRMKEDQLPDLPPRHEQVCPEAMSGEQLAAYEAVLQDARLAERRGAVLEALQRLRAICLHPACDTDAPDEAFIAESARLRTVFQTLDEISARSERALLFLDDLALQARLAGIIQRR